MIRILAELNAVDDEVIADVLLRHFKKNMSLRRINHHRRAEPQKDVKEAGLVDKPGKAERGAKKTERECISMKKKLPKKKAEVAKTQQTGNVRYQPRRRRRL